MKVVFIGCVESSAIFFRTLLKEKADIVAVITKSESKFNSDFIDLSGIAKQNNISYLYVKNMNDVEVYEFIKKQKADIGFCLGWSQLLKKELLDMFPKGVIGFHPAALPYNRGRHPLIWALVLGLNETASSFFVLEEGADTGKVISQERVPILYEDTARTLYDKVMKTAVVQLIKLWNDICTNNRNVVETGAVMLNSGQVGNTWRKRSRADGRIDWRMSSGSIYNLVRALSEPYIGAHFEYDGCEYKVWETKELSEDLYKNIEPGKILKVNDNKCFVIKTGTGVIEIIRYDKRFIPLVGMYL